MTLLHKNLNQVNNQNSINAGHSNNGMRTNIPSQDSADRKQKEKKSARSKVKSQSESSKLSRNPGLKKDKLEDSSKGSKQWEKIINFRFK